MVGSQSQERSSVDGNREGGRRFNGGVGVRQGGKQWNLQISDPKVRVIRPAPQQERTWFAQADWHLLRASGLPRFFTSVAGDLWRFQAPAGGFPR